MPALRQPLSDAGETQQAETEPVHVSLRRLAVACKENLRCLKPDRPQSRPFRRTPTSVFLARDGRPAERQAPDTSRRTGVSSPGNSRNLTRIVRPTRAIGVAAVLALSGH